MFSSFVLHCRMVDGEEVGEEVVVDVFGQGRPWNLSVRVGGQSENLLFLRQKHYLFMQDGK